MLKDTALLDTSAPAVISLTEARARPRMQNHPWGLMLNHGSLEVHHHRVNSVEVSGSHARDMVFTVIAGHGTLVRDGYDFPFHAGDLLFVPANLDRSFTDLSADFEAYGMVYGPVGGEMVSAEAIGEAGRQP